MEIKTDQVRRDQYDSPEIIAYEVQIIKVLCQSGEAPGFGEGWKWDL